MTIFDIQQLVKHYNAKLIETHISWVLLTKKFAYKIKRPVKNTFLDFSTLRKRKKYCEEEIRINSLLADKMYLKVVPIRKTKETYTIGENEGSIADYAVKMKRLDENKEMNKLLSKNEVKPTDIKKIAKKIALFHTKANIQSIQIYQRLKHEFWDLYDVLIASHIWTSDNLLKEKIEFQNANQFLDNHNSTFRRRVKNGWIREIHGDLHSGNIFIFPDPIIFDSIEFNKNFRISDVLYEIGFMCMDLEAYRKNNLSDLFLKEYLKESEFSFGEEEKKVFVFYKSYAANIRAKVRLLAYLNSPKNKRKNLSEFSRYYKLMKKYLKELSRN